MPAVKHFLTTIFEAGMKRNKSLTCFYFFTGGALSAAQNEAYVLRDQCKASKGQWVETTGEAVLAACHQGAGRPGGAEPGQNPGNRAGVRHPPAGIGDCPRFGICGRLSCEPE